MKNFYAKDLDELIKFRSEHFVETNNSTLKISDIDYWNRFNEDMKILPYENSYPLNKVVQKSLFSNVENHEIDYRIYYRKISIEGKPYVFMSQIAMIESKDLFRMLGVQYLLFFVIIVIGLLGIQFVLSRCLWKPFYNSLNEIEDFNLEKGEIPEFEKTTTTEFARLNGNLTKLMEENVASYKQQKEFTENASHELQTPLAVFQSQLDLLLQDNSLNESQMNVIESLYDVSSRLTRLNKNLLLLSRIDNSQFKETITIDFSQLLERQLTYFKELASNNGITLSANIQNALEITANKVLLESLINNLISNAIRHNYSGGFIHIEVNGNTFQIGNSGSKTPLDKEKVFRRFSRTSEERKGNGLGLSIINQICKLHGWEVRYNYKDEIHCFYVNFYLE
ncbi:sensor histidine kinase [Anaerorudis cellulosivorans]|uniref:sensor histidine kinase n=1 Tax=Anaerorudis cellulosivorans TaxID=3397862 RepID=UPI002220DBD2|nr:HAMP domain-containing sensor histidine kinase [Seramator thermalis]MCW1736235.1 HAMP domain-containing histidine kinase [Seramator thermalis]